MYQFVIVIDVRYQLYIVCVFCVSVIKCVTRVSQCDALLLMIK